MITSADNRQIKNIAALQKKAKERRVQGVFVTEGRKMFQEAPKELVKKVYVAEHFLKEEGAQELLRDTEYEVVADRIFAGVSDTVTPQGILSLIKKPVYRFEDLLQADRPRFLVLENIQDSGNLGTMLRAGEGAGITGIIMNRTTADLFSPKTVRATMGSIYRVPYFIAENFEETIGMIKGHGIRVYAAHLQGSVPYDAPDYTKDGTAFLIGNEGNGLTEETAGLADMRIRIPMEGRVESLNAGICAALLMYEAARQNRQNGEQNEDLV